MSVQNYAERQRYHGKPNDRPRRLPTDGRAKHACPRPERCDHCEMTIEAHAPIWYDRMRPLLIEHTNASGETCIQERIGAFCTPFCLHRHRERFATQPSRTPYP